jgi:outer membrane protein OmpA-like peptidoglycan-associated protein
MSGRVALMAAGLAALALSPLSAPRSHAATGANAAAAGRPSAASRELDRAQALLLERLASLPQDSGVLILRDRERLTLRIPARLLFEFDSTRLKPDASGAAALAASVQLLKKRRPLRAKIVAYSDSIGGVSANQSAAEQRAQAVYAALSAAGIAPKRLQRHAGGATSPVAANDTPQGRIENRRVEIEFGRSAAGASELKPAPAAAP